MQYRSQPSLDTAVDDTTCPFCRREDIGAYILKQTDAFLLLADHAPLIEGHVLIIPRQHFACYGAIPARLDTEIYTLKQDVRQFFAHSYDAPTFFWEHGVFRQTVFHAHLHCFPFGDAAYSLSEELHGAIVYSQEDIRVWYAARGPYFYLEDDVNALLFAAEVDRYLHIIKDVLWRGVVARSGQTRYRSQQERYAAGSPLIAATTAKWRHFQRQGGPNAGETSAR